MLLDLLSSSSSSCSAHTSHQVCRAYDLWAPTLGNGAHRAAATLQHLLPAPQQLTLDAGHMQHVHMQVTWCLEHALCT